MVDRTIIKADKDFDGKISFEEFCEVSIVQRAFEFVKCPFTLQKEYGEQVLQRWRFPKYTLSSSRLEKQDLKSFIDLREVLSWRNSSLAE